MASCLQRLVPATPRLQLGVGLAAIVFTYVLGNALGPAAAASLTRKLDRGGSDASELIREHIARVKEIAVQFPRLRTRVVTGAADYGATPENSFETGLQAILDGLETKLARAPDQDEQYRRTDAHAVASALPGQQLASPSNSLTPSGSVEQDQ